MKVVLFCGGLGMRLREYSEAIPKPLVPVGKHPILWHLMKYYAAFGHKDFILCLGWQGPAIKNYFLNYNECMSNDFVLSGGGRKIDLFGSDIDDWKITFVDTGPTSCIGERLKAIQPHVADEEVFLANYSDGLSDLRLPALIDFHRAHNSVATFLAVKPADTFHAVRFAEDGRVTDVSWVSETDSWINAGFFVFQREIFDYIERGEDLVVEPFRRLIAKQQLRAFKYTGFWACMDTYKQKQQLDNLAAGDDVPWAVWQRPTEKWAAATPLAEQASTDGAQNNVLNSNGKIKDRTLPWLPR
jgi:glucose-1-phosphate cytidylyltransferase